MMPTYLCVCSACKSPVVAVVTGCVLETETCFVAFSHSPLGAGIQQVIVAELVHAVVMSGGRGQVGGERRGPRHPRASHPGPLLRGAQVTRM